MNIRIAKFEDLKALVGIYNQAIAVGQKTADTTSVTVNNRKKWFSDHKPDIYPILVAQDGNEIIGYLTISAYRPGREALRYTAEVSYYIHFDHHRKEIASNLLQESIEMCPLLHIKTLISILMDVGTRFIFEPIPA